MLDYKDLAALPKTKAIYNIDRPDLLSYSPYVSYPSEERHYAEVSELAAAANGWPPLASARCIDVFVPLRENKDGGGVLCS